MADDTQQQQAPLNINDALQALIRQQLAAASGQQQVQLPSLPTPQVQTQYSNDPEKGPDLLQRIGLALGGGAMPGAPAELRAQMGSQGLLNFGIGLMSGGKFATPGEVLAGGLRGAQAGLLGNEAALAGQQEYALNAQTKMAELAAQQQKNRTEALTALVPLLQMRERLGLPPLFGPGSGGPGGGPGGGGGGGGEVPEVERDPRYETAGEQANNPGNLMTTSAPGQTGVIKLSGGRTLAAFPDVPTGVAANAANLAAYQTVHGINTVAEAVKRWVSDPKADLTSYINDVSRALGVKPTDQIDLTNPAVQRAFILAQQPHETGGKKQWLNPADVDAGIALAQKRLQGPPGAPGSPVGPYKVAGTGNVPPPTTQPSSGLPEPPQPPPGATPSPGDTRAPPAPAPAAGPVVPSLAPTTSTDPETGLPVLTPAGTPAVLTPPPPGQVTTPGGQLSPAPSTEQPPAVTPPAQPPAHAPDLTARNDDGSFVVPNDKLSLPDYQQRFRHVPTADELTQRGLVIPGNEAEAQAAARGVQEAEAAAQAAQTAANRAQAGYTGYGTVADLLKANTEAQAKAQDARQKYAEMLQDTTKTNAAALQKYYEKQDTDLAANYKAEVLDPRNAAALETQRGETQKDIERIKTGADLQRTLMQPDLDRLKAMGTQSDEMTNLAVNLQQLRAVLPNLPEAGWGAAIAQHLSPAAMGWMQAAGLGDPKQMNAVQALNGLAAYLSVQMRPTGSGALRNQEMDRFMQALPNLAQGAAGREKAVAFLLNYANRVQDENQFANEYFHRPKADGSPALNLIGVERAMNAPKSQGGLGEVVPHAPPLSAGPQAAQTFLSGIDSGRPYYAWVPKVDKSGTPIRNERGQVVYDYDLAVKP